MGKRGHAILRRCSVENIACSFESSWLNPLTRLSRDWGITTLSPTGGEGWGPVVFMLAMGPAAILKIIPRKVSIPQM